MDSFSSLVNIKPTRCRYKKEIQNEKVDFILTKKLILVTKFGKANKLNGPDRIGRLIEAT